MEIEGEDGEMNIAVYFDEDDNMLGTKIENSTFECIITSELVIMMTRFSLLCRFKF